MIVCLGRYDLRSPEKFVCGISVRDQSLKAQSPRWGQGRRRLRHALDMLLKRFPSICYDYILLRNCRSDLQRHNPVSTLSFAQFDVTEVSFAQRTNCLFARTALPREQ